MTNPNHVLKNWDQNPGENIEYSVGNFNPKRNQRFVASFL